MLLAIARVLFGFAFACLAAGLAQAVFVVTPAEVASSDPAARGEVVRGVGLLALIAATQTAVFAAPFALVALGLAEWQGIRSRIYYAAGGLGIALAGLLTQLAAETGERTVVNSYALAAFLLSGLAGGLVYWAVAGRFAWRTRNP